MSFRILVNGERFVLPNTENLLNDTDLASAMAYASDRARFYGEQCVECYLGESLIGRFFVRAEKCANYLARAWNDDEQYLHRRALCEQVKELEKELADCEHWRAVAEKERGILREKNRRIKKAVK